VSVNPALDLTPPPIEAHVWAQLSGIDGVKCHLISQSESYPFIRRNYTFQVEARGATRHAAGEAAEDARRAMLTLPEAVWEFGSVIGVSVVSGHAWLPGENGAPRYVARYEVAARPVS
jgi:hypothetical protein